MGVKGIHVCDKKAMKVFFDMSKVSEFFYSFCLSQPKNLKTFYTKRSSNPIVNSAAHYGCRFIKSQPLEGCTTIFVYWMVIHLQCFQMESLTRNRRLSWFKFVKQLRGARYLTRVSNSSRNILGIGKKQVNIQKFVLRKRNNGSVRDLLD